MGRRISPEPTAGEYRPDDLKYFRSLVKSTGMTRAALAKDVLGVTPRCLRMWMAGDRQFPYTAQFALEALVLGV